MHLERYTLGFVVTYSLNYEAKSLCTKIFLTDTFAYKGKDPGSVV